jgi:hypothetical protein
MVNIFRQHQKTLMIAVTVIVIVSFIWLYNRTQFEQIGKGRIGTVFGREVTMGDLDRSQRMFQLGLSLGFFEWAQTLGGMTAERSPGDFFLNSSVLENERARLGIAPSEESILETIRGLRRFQTNGQFDPNKYAMFVQDELSPRGFTESQLEEVVRSALSLSTLKTIIGSTIEVSPTEVRAICDLQFRKSEASIVRFKQEDLVEGVTVADDEIAKAFEARKDRYQSEEQRKVKFVKLSLDEAQAKLEKKEKTGALQALADKAQAFAESLLQPETTFESAAKQAGIEVAETGLFPQGAPDPALGSEPRLVSAIFQIPADHPDSDVIQSGDSFYVVRIAEVVPSKPLTLDEAKPRVTADLKAEKARETMDASAKELRAKIEEALKGGKPFEQAASEAGAKPEKLPAFSIADVSGGAGPPAEVVMKVTEMKEGELSPFVPGEDQGFLIYLEKRVPLDEDLASQQKGRIEMLLERGRRDAAFAEWLRLRREEAGKLAEGLFR